MSGEQTRRRRLIIFDVEGVLVPKRRFLFFEVGRNLRFLQFLEIAFYGFLYEIGLISLEKALSRLFRVFKGMEIAEPLHIFKQIPILPDTEKVFKELKIEGFRIALISSGLPQAIVQDLGSRLGSDYCFGLDLGSENGILTGEITGDVIKKSGKLRVLRGILAAEELLPEDCVVVADDRNNSSMFLPEILKIGYNPDFIIKMKADTIVSGRLPEILPIIQGGSKQEGRMPNRNDVVREAIHASGFFIPVIALTTGVFPVAFLISIIAILYGISEVERMEGRSMPLISLITRLAATHQELFEFTTAPLFFALGIALTLLLFPLPLAGAAVAAFALGDSTASLFGKALGKTRLPFNRGKTLEGSLISFFFAFLASAYFITPSYAIIAAALAVIIESLPLPLNDNLTTPLITALILSLVIA